MVLRYLNNSASQIVVDRTAHAHLTPGSFLIFPSAIQADIDVDPDAEFFDKMLDDPIAIATLMHEITHYLSVVGTTYGHNQMSMEWGTVFQLLANTEAVGRIVKDAGGPAQLNTRLQNSKEVRLRPLKIGLSYIDGFDGDEGACDRIVEFFPSVRKPEESYNPPAISVIGPHSGLPSILHTLGFRSILEGIARSVEYRALNEYRNRDESVKIGSFLLRDEQSYYQVSRCLVFDRFKKDDHSQTELWHALITDLALMGPTLFELRWTKPGTFRWEDTHPGWRYWNLAAAYANLVEDDRRWPLEDFNAQEYTRRANFLSGILGWPSYTESLQIGEQSLKLTEQYEGSNTYFMKILRHAWKYKKKYPHIFFAANLHHEMQRKLLSDFLLPPIVIGKKYMRIRDDFLTVEHATDLLNYQSIATQCLDNSWNGKLQCYNRFFGFDCPDSNERCGIVPNVETPENCPFLKRLCAYGFDFLS